MSLFMAADDYLAMVFYPNPVPDDLNPGELMEELLNTADQWLSDSGYIRDPMGAYRAHDSGIND